MGKIIVYKRFPKIEKQLIKERDARKALYKKYKRGINITDGVDTTLISAGVIMAGLGLTVPLMLPLEIIAIVCGCMNSIKDLISKALQDGQISESEFKMVLCELEKYNDLKDKARTKQSGLSEAEKNKLIQAGKTQALSIIQKK